MKVNTVAAFGCVDGECLVGLVVEDDGDHVSVELYNWLLGYFDLGVVEIDWDDIRAVKLAERCSHGDHPWLNDPSVTDVWDMDPLGEFQTQWGAA